MSLSVLLYFGLSSLFFHRPDCGLTGGVLAGVQKKGRVAAGPALKAAGAAAHVGGVREA